MTFTWKKVKCVSTNGGVINEPILENQLLSQISRPRKPHNGVELFLNLNKKQLRRTQIYTYSLEKVSDLSVFSYCVSSQFETFSGNWV